MTGICLLDSQMTILFGQEGSNVEGKITVTAVSIYKVLRKFISCKLLFYNYSLTILA